MAIATAEVRRGIQEVSIRKLYPSKTNPRKTFDPAELEKLAASIRSMGILSPILARPLNDGDGSGDLEVVAGERRLRAAKIAELESVPVIVRKMTDEEALEAQLAENLEREDVHPLEQADGFAQLRDRLNWPVEKIAEKFGISVSEIYMTIKLLELCPEGKKVFRDGKITSAHAERIARLRPEDQRRTLKAVISRTWIEGEQREVILSVRDLSGFISREIVRDIAAAPWKATDAELVKKAGPCSTCPKRAGNDPAMKELKPTACTDGACFDAKLEAALLRKVAELRKKSAAGVCAIAEYGQRDYPSSKFGTVVRANELRWVGGKSKKCRFAVPVLRLDGAQAGTFGLACRNEQCSTHVPSWARRKPMTERQLARRKAEITREKIAAEFRSRLYRGLGEKAQDGIDLKTWRAIVGFLYEELVGDSRRPFLRAMGIEISEEGVMGRSAALDRKLAKAGNAELDRILVLLAAASSSLRADYGVDRVKHLAKLMKMNTGRILAEVKRDILKEPGK